MQMAKGTQSPLLQMAESYYAVSEDMRRQGTEYIRVANMLAEMADHICNENMRRNPPAPEGSAPSENDKP